MFGAQKKVETTNLVLDSTAVVAALSLAHVLEDSSWSGYSPVEHFSCNCTAGESLEHKLNPAGPEGSAALAQPCPEGREGVESPVRSEFLLVWHSRR